MPTNFEKLDQTALAIANYFIKKSDSKVTPLQLIKLVYISYGYTLAILNKKLFNEEIEAWQFGPVIPSVYHSFKHFGRSNIKEVSKNLTFDDELNFIEVTPEINIENEDEHELVDAILDKVWDRYQQYNGYELIDLTHKENTPWDNVYTKGKRGLTINDESIYKYYNELLG